MITEKFDKRLIIEPVVDGANEILPRSPEASDGWWSNATQRGRRHRFDNGTGLNVMITDDGYQQIEAPGLVEVGREWIGKFPNLRLVIRFKKVTPENAPVPDKTT